MLTIWRTLWSIPGVQKCSNDEGTLLTTWTGLLHIHGGGPWPEWETLSENPKWAWTASNVWIYSRSGGLRSQHSYENEGSNSGCTLQHLESTRSGNRRVRWLNTRKRKRLKDSYAPAKRVFSWGINQTVWVPHRKKKFTDGTIIVLPKSCELKMDNDVY